MRLEIPRPGPFKYYVGITSLAQVATREDRVCVLNVLGGESSEVTPVGHTFSGGNVVFGTSPGRRGQVLETPLGPIPVYNNVRDGLADGHRFNCGVVYLPPSGARDGVAELIRVNPELRKIFIITEKMSVRDAREIRAMAQQNQIDVFGANSLGVADSWNRVRIGGALGGDNPAEALRPGSIAIFSNSGNFTTTIATYLRMAGWGTTTLISSGKDVYIHFAAPEFAFALANDARSKAAVLYSEPGGYYELEAAFTKPVVACVVGRWKSKLTRAVGHAGALGGSSDDARAKEGWFLEKFGVDGIFTPENPIFSVRGALVTNIAHIPAALSAVMGANATRPDFEPEGSLTLKPWFGSNAGLALAPSLDIPVVEALQPYNEQIVQLDKRLGAAFPRENMKDASGASHMDALTQVTTLHGVSMLDAARNSVEGNVALALFREAGGEAERALLNVAINAEVNLCGQPALLAAEAARAAGNAPNTILAAACSAIGPRHVASTLAAAEAFVELFAHSGLKNAFDVSFDLAAVRAEGDVRARFLGAQPDFKARAMLEGLRRRGATSAIVRWLESLGGEPTADAVLAAIAVTLAWGPLMRKRISLLTATSAPWHLRLLGTMIGASVAAERHEADRFCGVTQSELLGTRSLTEVVGLALLGATPAPADLFALQTLIGLMLSNGPGTISAQGAKGAVSSDGPEAPRRVQLNKAMIGFLTHTGYAHGGNGYEGIAFLIDRFRGLDVRDPGDPEHGLDLGALAKRCAGDYAAYKAEMKSGGSLDIDKIPGVNHPVFKDKAVNFDPREVFISDLFARRGEYNVFLAFYKELVTALHEAGVSRTVYCVNIDAVIAALLLKILWRPYQSGTLGADALETAAFTVFLYARMLGCAAEIDDHLNRGRNMDTRTPASRCRIVT